MVYSTVCVCGSSFHCRLYTTTEQPEASVASLAADFNDASGNFISLLGRGTVLAVHSRGGGHDMH